MAENEMEDATVDETSEIEEAPLPVVAPEPEEEQIPSPPPEPEEPAPEPDCPTCKSGAPAWMVLSM